MVKDQLIKAVERRLKELGLPQSLMGLGDFGDKFLGQQWVMFVRDHDKLANVHLVQPQPGAKSGRCSIRSDRARSGRPRSDW
jgi:hypothetical protein